MPVYNKLIRDKILEQIQRCGKNYKIEVLSEEQYVKELKEKLKEEVGEYLLSDTNVQAIEELADILEVIHALAKVHGYSFQDVEDIRREKEVLRGRFEKRLFLVSVDDK